MCKFTVIFLIAALALFCAAEDEHGEHGHYHDHGDPDHGDPDFHDRRHGRGGGHESFYEYFRKGSRDHEGHDGPGGRFEGVIGRSRPGDQGSRNHHEGGGSHWKIGQDSDKIKECKCER